MDQEPRFRHFLRRFDDPAVEAGFETFVFRDNLSTNRLGVMVGIPLFLLYGFLDFLNLQEPIEAVVVRGLAAGICWAALFGMYDRRLAQFHEWLTAAVVIVLGSAMIFIIWREPSLDNAYYIGLIQVGVFLTFLSRMAVFKAFISLALILFLFGLAVSTNHRSEQAVLQFIVLLTMFAIFGFGIVVSDGLRRKDYLKSRTIALQNEKLNAMLADVQLDNARKVAAMNLLVHFVKTPIHQIVGFTDVIRNQLEDLGAGGDGKNCLESAAFIQSASKDLSRNVSRLLAYYRLDEKASAEPDLVELDALVHDHLERLPAPPRIALDRIAIVNRREVVGDAVLTMIDRYVDNRESRSLVDVRIERAEKAATLIFTDEGPAVSEEEFAQQTRPLDKLDHYLTANGSSMMLGLRTVARAAEICGGTFRHRRAEGRNVFTLELPDLAADGDRRVA